ncbi:polysaccharide biosynthesis protein [Sabulilitoribacter arenilitoris]|uniref:Polysaccharide biosynthesis protein n=1 Tax=Wocania arenilitoris TaxID=2044858 RepID=A0AAE3ENG5_9FLAO|nr:SDR family NAD(P)-dependent oxidoreductase [Wocania arenilitoris]MCF7568663.1 polysaccharide biosynthesis protein [Wocania arenilitoris]
MNNSTLNHIKQLIADSGLIHSKTNSKKKYPNLDFSNDTILITGAAGSIGAELTKQLVDCNYKKLILVDIAESPLYELQKELENKSQHVEFILLNITEKESLNYLFKTHKPTLIFHTAAYKHVPLMESNPYEAVKLNIIGTKLLADLSITHSVKKFIFISTDKAVNPISVMGMTKRIAEYYLLNLNIEEKTKFIITRFGNIFGSNGSVVPLFISQINSGKPLTVTNKNISRYFICKGEACNLILKIATFKNFESSIFTFNMGNPIKILDLAKVLITFFDGEIDIKITNIRPGEKLHEDIISIDETLVATAHKEIMQVKRKKDILPNISFDALFKITPYNSNSEIKKILKTYL